MYARFAFPGSTRLATIELPVHGGAAVNAGAVALAAHVAFGTVALLLAPLSLWLAGAGDRHRTLLSVFHVMVLGTVAASLVLIALDPARLWWLSPLAALTVALVVIAHRREPIMTNTRLRLRVHARGGVVIALVTATAVVSVDGPAQPAAWVLPSVLGIWLIERWYRRAAARSGLPTPTRSAM